MAEWSKAADLSPALVRGASSNLAFVSMRFLPFSRYTRVYFTLQGASIQVASSFEWHVTQNSGITLVSRTTQASFILNTTSTDCGSICIRQFPTNLIWTLKSQFNGIFPKAIVGQCRRAAYNSLVGKWRPGLKLHVSIHVIVFTQGSPKAHVHKLEL